MDKAELNSSSSTPTTVAGSLSTSRSQLGGSKLSSSNSVSFKDRVRNRISKNKVRVKELDSFMSECETDTSLLHQLKKEITIDNTDRIGECLERLQCESFATLSQMEQECRRKDNQLMVLNGLKKCEEKSEGYKFVESEYTDHYKHLDQTFRQKCLRKHNLKFEKCVKDSDQMYKNAQQLMLQLNRNLQKKNAQVKETKKTIKQKQRKLKQLMAQKRDLQRTIDTMTKNSELKNIEMAEDSITNLNKDVGRLMTERYSLQQIEMRVKDQLRHMTSSWKHLEVELEIETKELNTLKEKLTTYSTSFRKNKRLSESVDLDHSRLESFLNIEKETKQDLLNEVNKRKKALEVYKQTSKDCISRRSLVPSEFINSPFEGDLESVKSHESGNPNYDFLDLTNERKYIYLSAS